MRMLLNVIGLILALFVSALLLFLVLWVEESIRLPRRVVAIERWIGTEIPAGSSVEHATLVLRRHSVPEDTIGYNPRTMTLGAAYPHCNYWFEPLDAHIGMTFVFDRAGHPRTSQVVLSYTFF